MIKENLKIFRKESEEYLTSYMEFLKPFGIGNITIVPNLKNDSDKLNDSTLYIAKQYAFGTGTHETTSLALEMINEYSENNDIASKCCIP